MTDGAARLGVTGQRMGRVGLLRSVGALFGGACVGGGLCLAFAIAPSFFASVFDHRKLLIPLDAQLQFGTLVIGWIALPVAVIASPLWLVAARMRQDTRVMAVALGFAATFAVGLVTDVNWQTTLQDTSDLVRALIFWGEYSAFGGVAGLVAWYIAYGRLPDTTALEPRNIPQG